MTATQHVFDFYDNRSARPERPERLFFGLVPDPGISASVRQVVEGVIGEHLLRARPIEARCQHVSLHHVGDYRRLRSQTLHAATQAGKAVSMQPFEITFQCMRSFEGRDMAIGEARANRPVVLLAESEALRRLHVLLGTAMRRNGLRAGGSFVPHMTLFYGSTQILAQAIEPIRFMAREFRLVHSELGLTRHNTIDRWPFAG